ncbi:hypothetical protein AGROH133_15312 (plasmid) [Agrobacterium tumefaciens]|nr:hypothetical protein AGROH133_15312 [Agrobacterium tumefaciens]
MPVLAYVFDPAWLVSIVIVALLDDATNAKRAFDPRQATTECDILNRLP